MLFIAQAKVRYDDYMGDTRYENVVRLIEANDAEQAEKKLEKEYNKNNPFGTSSLVVGCIISEMIR